MNLRLYDTMAREKRPFVPANPDRVTMYVCGPTVYGFAHIGNARPVVAFDVLFRLLRHIYGAEHVIYARNVTDVDDKINAKAAAEGAPIRTITDRYLAAYHADMDGLLALRPSLEPRATDFVAQMVAMMEDLIHRNGAYVAEGHVLFDTQAAVDYGALSGRSLDDMIAGARVEVAPYKRHPADFVLWKPSKEGEPAWPSPWGDGRPGWHSECSTMIEEVLGLPIDIHGGGIDLVFPHHENELAQARCGHPGQEFARFWMHNGFLDMAGEKMSKSLGNVIIPHDLLKVYPGEVLRWALLSAHYRQPLDWTEELIDQSRKALDRLYGVLRRVMDVQANDVGPPNAFLEALSDDLNSPKAIAELFALGKALETADEADRPRLKGELLAAANLMGFLAADPDAWFEGGDAGLKTQVEALLARRVEARTAKDWPAADAIRAELDALGVVVMDSATGATWRMKDV
ncbi:cysteinyl-tRNA synthetase [Caulobacter ginsengisoli]|uniref:Cysteine--tRNA ligase n=1 Tax=Caulobacter ginsengisoli TaxID=400775 RepID=A0ABU0IWE1_9CAUL|nr:cysteine--tRNA ligase [Caulobacter ginsengisoli]MDQ0466329.1 cysteinyl-tRNA synthetase [Caulobacter ginsengisoli]